MSCPVSSLVAGVKIGSGSLSHCRKPARQPDAADRPRRLILLPSRPGQVPAGDALDRHDPRLSHQHRPPRKLPREGLQLRPDNRATSVAIR